jgi:hypothetical protein
MVSVDGNIPLYSKLTISGKILVNSNGGGYLPGQIVLTKELTKINQPVMIALPASYPDLGLDPGMPLPPGTELDSVNLTYGVTQYLYLTQANEEDFKTFYANLPTSSGWKVEKAGPLGEHYDCNVCFILANGKTRVRVLWKFDLGIRKTILANSPPELY